MTMLDSRTAAAGTYAVVTASHSVYVVTVVEGGEPVIVRNPLVPGLQLDGQPMTGVTAFLFDSGSGVGQIEWTRLNPEDRDFPDLPYAGTVRRTNTVLLVATVSAGQSPADAIFAAASRGALDEGALREVVGVLAGAETAHGDDD